SEPDRVERLAVAAEGELVAGTLRDIVPDRPRQALPGQRLELEDVDWRRARARRRALREGGTWEEAAADGAQCSGNERDRLATLHDGILGLRLGAVKRTVRAERPTLRRARRRHPEETEAVVPGDVRVHLGRQAQGAQRLVHRQL